MRATCASSPPPTGLEIPEKILANDDASRHFAYRITAPQYAFHLGVIDVIEIADNDSLCVYSTTALPDTLALLIAGGTARRPRRDPTPRRGVDGCP